MNTEKNEIPPADKSNKHQWIKEVARQSWEPELFISGAAAFASLGLPGFIKSGYEVYINNLMGNGFLAQVFPIIIFSLLMSIAQILSITFFLHLSMRAFWVGMMGLLSVYPKGIELDKIPTLSNYARQYLKPRLMTVDDFIIKLDRTCSILFSIAFLIILFMVGIVSAYALLFLVVFASRQFIPAQWFTTYQIVLGTILGLALVSMFFFTLLVKAQRKKSSNQEKYDRWLFLLNHRIVQIVMPGISKLIPYVLYPFSSNWSKKSSAIAMLAVMLPLMALININTQVMEQREASPETRNYYSQGSDAHHLQANYYENLRDNSQMVRSVTIQSDLIKEPILKLFIAYPKKRDAMLEKICGQLPKVDQKLKKHLRKRKQDAQRLACIEQLYKIYINDQEIKSPNFMYYQSPTHHTKGVMAYIPLKGLKYGSKNILEVKSSIPRISMIKKLRKPLRYSLPFWYLANAQ